MRWRAPSKRCSRRSCQPLSAASSVRRTASRARATPESWNRHDVPGYVAFWTEDAHFVNVLGMHRRSRRELQAELEWLHSGRFRNTQIRIERVETRLLSPELALVHVEWRMSGDPGMPNLPTERGERRGIFTQVAHLRPDGWRVIASQNTDQLPIADQFRI